MADKQKVIVVGSSGHAKVILDILERMDVYEIHGIVDEHLKKGESFYSYPIIGNDLELPKLIDQNENLKIFIAIGDNWLRKKVSDKLLHLIPRLNFANAIHPNAQIARGVKLGNGIAIMAGAVVNSDTTIGDFAILNTNSSIDHDCIMGEYASMGPNSSTGGNVAIGAFTAISLGASISHGLSIGQHAIIGAGACLLKNCPDNCIMYGIPAKEVKTREIGDNYL